MSDLYSFRNPVLSLWQSAAAEVHRRRSSVFSRMGDLIKDIVAPAENMAKSLMAPAYDVAAKIENDKSPAALLKTPDGVGVKIAETAMTAADCASVASRFLWAEITGNQQEADLCAGMLKYSECDGLGWAECLTTYLGYKALHDSFPYRPNKDVVIDLGNISKIAIIGDWGTGDNVAINVLKEVAKLKPDVLLHLGDVYYACTQSEAHGNFFDVCKVVLGDKIPLFSLCGNHDMYSGGDGYYWLVDRIGQQASYFCLQTPEWQFVAVDTGHNDNNPGTVSTNMTSLVSSGAWSEAAWALNKINSAGSRKTVMLSHHQLFSPFSSVGSVGTQAYAYNPNLYEPFQTVLQNIEWWFWGHEHTLGIYDPYMGLKRGRCLGGSAVPVFVDQQQYATADGLQTLDKAPMPTWNPTGILGNQHKTYDNCFAIMTLNGPSANVDYYSVPLLKPAVKLNVTDNN